MSEPMTPELFRQSLDALHLSNKDFAEMVGIRAETVSRYATGKRPVPRIVQIILKLNLAYENQRETIRHYEKIIAPMREEILSAGDKDE